MPECHAFLNKSEKRDFFEKKFEKKNLPPKICQNFVFDPELTFCISEKVFLKKIGGGRKNLGGKN